MNFLRQHFLFLVMLLSAALIWSKDISYPSQPYFDEVYYAPTVKEYLNWDITSYDFHYQKQPNPPYDWTHPPLARLFSSIGVWIWGDNSFGWRVPSLLNGLGSLTIFYALTIRLFSGDKFLAFVTVLIYIFDILPMVQSRILMNEINFVFFSMLTFLILTYYYKKPSFLTAVFLGLSSGSAIATRWAGFFLLLIVFLVISFVRLRSSLKESFILLRDCLAILLVGAFIYFGSYFQYFILGGTIKSFWSLQREMWNYHYTLKATHEYQTSWWNWPLLLRSTWYYVEYLNNGLLRNIYALGNPLIWWAGLAALGYALFKWFRRKSFSLGLILLGYFGLWLPWAASPRIGFLHYYLPSLPFLYLSLGLALKDLWARKNFLRIGVGVYMLLIIFTFFYFYPIAIGSPLSREDLNKKFWLSSWR